MRVYTTAGPEDVQADTYSVDKSGALHLHEETKPGSFVMPKFLMPGHVIPAEYKTVAVYAAGVWKKCEDIPEQNKPET